MGNDQFQLSASRDLVKLFDQASNQTGLSRGQVFEDFLTITRCTLAGQTMEEEYLATVAKGYAKGHVGKRGIDTLKTAFHAMVDAMEDTRQDILGDVFTGGITYGEHGQFFTPDSVCEIMAALNVPTERTEEPKTVCDPACGSGRMLLGVAKFQPHWEFTGQDVDHRSVQMTAINMGLNGLRGWAVWQNTLSLECHRVYRIGMHLRGAAPGVLYEVPVDQSPFDYDAQKQQITPDVSVKAQPEPPRDPPEPGGARQLDLF